MAKLDSEIGFIGTIGNLTAYRLPGTEGIVVKRKSVVPKHVIKNSPTFQNSRRVSQEFGGRATMSGWVRRAMQPLLSVADYNLTGPLNAMFKPVQELDQGSKYGERHVLLTKGRYLLEGFSLTRKHSLETIIQSPISHSLSRAELKAKISIPSLMPDRNFHPLQNHPLYRITVALGIIPNVLFSPNGYLLPLKEDHATFPVAVESDWHFTAEGSDEIKLEISDPSTALRESDSVILTLGIKFGKMIGIDTARQIPKTGAAKVVAVV